MRVLLETDNALVGYNDTKKAIIVLWSSKGKEKEFREIYHSVLKSFKIYFVDTLINDLGGYGNLSPAECDFLRNKIFPLTVKCGLRKIISVDNSSKNTETLNGIVEELKTKTKRDLLLKNASTFQEAYDKIAV